MLGTLQAFSYLPEQGQVVGLLLSFISRSSQSMNKGLEQNLLRSSARSSGPGVGGPKSHPPTHTVCRLGGPYRKDYSIFGSTLGSPDFRKLPYKYTALSMSKVMQDFVPQQHSRATRFKGISGLPEIHNSCCRRKIPRTLNLCSNTPEPYTLWIRRFSAVAEVCQQW